ncbi:MAG: DUF3857 domain-containing protein, partial [Burkholderiaceae bacterium]|nr:DUF3857 domain-containing protein [Burkholderiaceae bacterium]
MLNRLVAISLFAAFPNVLLANTSPAPYEAPSTIVRDDIHYAVEADGTYVVEEIETDKINSDQGVKSRAQISLSYSTSLQSLDILEAYTTTKDGRRIDVASDKILLQESAVSRYAPTFDDTKVKVIVFPSVEVGATVTLHYKKKQNKPIFPGQFSMIEVFSKNTEIQSEQLTLTAPKSLALGIDAQGVEGGEVASDDSAHKTWRWHIENAHASTPQAIAVSASDYSPHVA